VRQLLPVYYALGDTRTPVIVSAIDLCAFIGIALALRGPLGHVGIGYAVSGSSAVQMLLLWVLLRRRLADLRLGEIAASVARTALASIVAAIGGRAVASLVPVSPGASWWLRPLPGIAGGLAFAALGRA
jgi:putative peptidoglycan lipid II flippase